MRVLAIIVLLMLSIAGMYGISWWVNTPRMIATWIFDPTLGVMCLAEAACVLCLFMVPFVEVESIKEKEE